MAGLIPLMIALVLIEKTAHSGRMAADPTTLFWWVAGTLGLWWLVCAGSSWLLAKLSANSQAPTAAGVHTQRMHQLLARWDMLVQTLALGIFAWFCYYLGWSRFTAYYSLALAPWAVLQCIHWWCLALPVRTLTGTRWTRWSFLSHQVRFSLLPLTIALPVLDLCVLFARRSGLEASPFFAQHMALINILGALLLALALVGLLPWLLVRLWHASPMPAGPVHDDLVAACLRAGVRVAGILSWPVGGGRAYNAMVMGVLPRLRYVLFTADLLRDFPREERLAVLGHELGHARYRHLWIYLLFAAVTAIASWLVREPLERVVDVVFQHVPAGFAVEPDLRAVVIALLLLGIQWRLLFGWLSRVCERQADLAGAELAGEGDQRQGAMAMQCALGNVARLSGTDPRAPSWRHHSIAQRIDFLTLVADDQQVAVNHHRLVRRTVLGLLVCVLGLAVLAWMFRQM